MTIKEILHYAFQWRKQNAEFKKQMVEIEYRRERLRKAHALHMDVLHNYGLDAYSKLASMDSIVEGDVEITVINYLDI